MKGGKLMKIPIKPLSVNKAWQGRRYKTKEYKMFENQTLMLLPDKVYNYEKYSVKLIFYIKNVLKSDIDNFVKPFLDILVKKGIIKDDRYIYKLEAEKRKSKEEYIEVFINENS